MIKITKKIVVDCCVHCPLKKCWRFREKESLIERYICTHPETDGMVLITTSIIHPDCPLEDNDT